MCAPAAPQKPAKHSQKMNSINLKPNPDIKKWSFLRAPYAPAQPAKKFSSREKQLDLNLEIKSHDQRRICEDVMQNARSTQCARCEKSICNSWSPHLRATTRRYSCVTPQNLKIFHLGKQFDTRENSQGEKSSNFFQPRGRILV